MSAQRPVVTNGIPELVTRPDLLSRAIPLTLAPITNYRTERQFYLALERVLPEALGGLLDAASAALANIEGVEQDSRARMADFGRWAAAAAPALGWSPYEFLDTYASNRETAEETVLETSTIATALCDFAEGRRHYEDTWTGTATELFEKITPNPVPKDWPKNPRGLSSAIRRYAPVLRSRGVSVEMRKGTQGIRQISIEMGGANVLDFAPPEDRFAPPIDFCATQNEHEVAQKAQVAQARTSSPNSETTGEFKELLSIDNNIDTNGVGSEISDFSPEIAPPAPLTGITYLDGGVEL